MSGRFDRSGWALALALAGTGAFGQTTADPPASAPIPLPMPKATVPTNLAPGQNAATATTSMSQPRVLHGEAASLGVVTELPSEALDPPLAAVPGVVADQVIGVVNGDLILESDIDAERRFEEFEPFSAPGAFSRDKVVERLVDRTLILEQAKLQSDQGVTAAQAEAQLQMLRKDLPACKNVCETDAGWEKFVHDKGFTMDELVARWQQRMEILKFIEQRFRAGIDVTPAEIQAYYQTRMLPVYAKSKVTPPKLAVLSDRIQEILLEQKVSSLLEDWLQSLKAEGSVRMMRPGEEQP